MNPIPYITFFAWISIIALSASIFSSYWLPMLIGAIGITLLLKLIR